jgi:ankyrin repeat protein
MVELLLRRGANIWDTDNDGDTTLICAAVGNKLANARLLLEHEKAKGRGRGLVLEENKKGCGPAQVRRLVKRWSGSS